MELIYSKVNGLLTNWFWNHHALNDCGQSWAFWFFFTLKDEKKANHMIVQFKKNPTPVIQDAVWKCAYHVGH